MSEKQNVDLSLQRVRGAMLIACYEIGKAAKVKDINERTAEVLGVSYEELMRFGPARARDALGRRGVVKKERKEGYKRDYYWSLDADARKVVGDLLAVR